MNNKWLAPLFTILNACATWWFVYQVYGHVRFPDYYAVMTIQRDLLLLSAAAALNLIGAVFTVYEKRVKLD